MADETDKNIEMWKIKRVSNCSFPVLARWWHRWVRAAANSVLLPARVALWPTVDQGA